MTSPRLAVIVCGALALARPATAQVLEVGAYLANASYREPLGEWSGWGPGVAAAIAARRLRLEVAAHRVRFQVAAHPVIEGGGFWVPTGGFQSSVLDARASIRLISLVSAEVGAGRSFVRPALEAPEMGLVRVGLRFDSQLGAGSRLWARASFIPVVRFSTGGRPEEVLLDSDLDRSVQRPFEAGFGASVALGHGRLRLSAGYDVQRVSRLDHSSFRYEIWSRLARFGAHVRL